MINLLSLFLITTSLLTAGVFSPTPQNSEKEDVIVKDGHRVVVVEYDQNGQHNTKVLISPYEENPIKKQPTMEEKISSAANDVLENTKGKFREASSVFQVDVKAGEELVCDAYDICRDKVTGAIVKTKEEANEAKEGVLNMAHNVKEGAKGSVSKAKHTVEDKKGDVKESVKESILKAKHTVEEKTGDVKESAKRPLSWVAKEAKEAKDLGKTIREDVVRNVSEFVNIRDDIVEKAKQGSEKATIGLKRGFGVWIGLMRYWSSDAVRGLMRLLNLLGFAVAYGVSMWVTFVSSYVLGPVLPRQQLGVVQSKIYPVYFRVLGCSIGLALLGHTPLFFGGKGDVFQGFNLLGSVLMVLVNCFYLEPRATKVMFERMRVDKEEGRGSEGIAAESSRAATQSQPTTTRETEEERLEQEAVRLKLNRLSERLKKLNSYSSLLNISTLMSLSWHLVYLAQCISPGH